ncbi:dephospho-CoA kinase [Helicobacter brantae]|uniref:Dephospho-CoA kinase n=1 Tax=Helicobacter brantae TaxID=375927 RepID=A0A3D8IZT9_9HELI|nr:dephospho-CoA kinase [Helicobacter brantae]RDU70787.1 dephospho-CoA kinase [Helicobacter brantae]
MDFSQFDYAYAISGGIGSGKSSVCNILATLGYKVLDADKIAHQVLREQSQKVIEVFGERIVGEGGINRKALGEIVFEDRDKLEQLQNILNPYIYQELFSQCQQLEREKKPYFVEIALLFEQRERLNFRHKILITAPKEVILQRVQERDGTSQMQVLQRIASQLPSEEKIPYASEVIENDSDFLGLERKIEKWVRGIVS